MCINQLKNTSFKQCGRTNKNVSFFCYKLNIVELIPWGFLKEFHEKSWHQFDECGWCTYKLIGIALPTNSIKGVLQKILRQKSKFY